MSEEEQRDFRGFLLFELHGPDGQVWKLYEKGHIEGFPPGTLIVNRAHPIIGAARSEIESLRREQKCDGPVVSNQKPEIL